jgi:hypothetical protein
VPIVENDPWRRQYFQGIACPDDVFVPTEDPDCYRLYPQHRWIYNKLLVAESQGLPCGPHGVVPEAFPVFSKPVYNLRGMGIETRIFHDRDEYLAARDPGHMWMPVLAGEHVSSDAAVVAGQARWWRHTVGHPLAGGMFDYWTVLAEAKPDLEAYCHAWIAVNLPGYTGMLNLETIGKRIIEVHLRFADQWPDLYGPGWIEAVVELYEQQRWAYADADRRTGYSVVLFGPHGPAYRRPAPALEAELRANPAVSSVQFTFFEDKRPELHAMPPGGFRLAVVNCWDLAAGRAARQRLVEHFRARRDLRPAADAAMGNRPHADR